MRKTNLKLAETLSTGQGRAEQFANYVALVSAHPKTPRRVKDALAAIIIEDIANSSSYVWDEDAEGLRFMLPRLLAGMKESYADGIISAAVTVTEELLPKEVSNEVKLGTGGAR